MPVPVPAPVLPVTVLAQHGRACRIIRLQGTGEPVDRWSMLVNRHGVKRLSGEPKAPLFRAEPNLPLGTPGRRVEEGRIRAAEDNGPAN